MNKVLTHSISTVLLSSAIVITGCSSDGGGASGPAVPVNAAAIDATNAFTLVQRASLAGYAITEATDSNSSAINLTNCTVGSSSSTVVENQTLTSLTESGQVTLNGCGTWVSGLPDTYLIDGVLTYSYSEITNIAAAQDSINQSVIGNAIGLTTPNDTVTVNGYNISTTGTLPWSGAGDYSTTGMFSYDSLTLGEGFSALISTPLTGPLSWWSGLACPTGGVILVTGASGSQARGTFQNNANVLIEYKASGSTTWTTDAEYACSAFES